MTVCCQSALALHCFSAGEECRPTPFLDSDEDKRKSANFESIINNSAHPFTIAVSGSAGLFQHNILSRGLSAAISLQHLPDVQCFVCSVFIVMFGFAVLQLNLL